MMESWSCEECDVVISASGSATLAWCVETHRCVAPLAEMMGNDRMGRFDRLVVMWLVDAYGRPFYLHRPGSQSVLVT